MPVFADQPENAEKIKDKGFGNNLEKLNKQKIYFKICFQFFLGLMLNRHSIVKEEVLRSINEIMNNSR